MAMKPAEQPPQKEEEQKKEEEDSKVDEPPAIRRKYLRFGEDDSDRPVESQPVAAAAAAAAPSLSEEGIVLEEDGEEFVEATEQKGREKGQKQANVGNYPRYYGYRPSGREDPRLAHIRAEWVSAKDCLDIGCNGGAFTLAVAERYRPQTMIGSDADTTLIAQARARLAEADRQRLRVRRNRKPGAWNLANCVSFVAEDFVAAENTVDEQPRFDCILCMSVTKWVHLNAGDDGLMRLFRRAFALLRENGVFVLEPQPWQRYRRRANLTPAMHANFTAAKLRPDTFPALLVSPAIGFSECITLHMPKSGADHKGTGFDRPIYAFYKRQGPAVK